MYRSDSFLEQEALWLKVPFSKLLRLRLSGWGEESGVTNLGFFVLFCFVWGRLFWFFCTSKRAVFFCVVFFCLFFFLLFFLMFPPFQAPELMNLPLGMEGKGVSDGLG